MASPETVAPEINGARWPQTSIPVHYCLDPDNGYIGGDVVLQLLAKAFSTWGVPTKSDGTCSGPASTDDGRNEISWAGLSQPGSGLTEAGKTSLRYRIPSRGTAQIIEADIELDNNTPRSRRDKECLYTTILHETGHFLGLHHLGSGTIMAPVVTECAQDLTPEDKQALSELY
ncbi:MAG TPA: matrixin family metalloprotease [Dehalococcoidia bacterium]|nr:matrixin family metalloprotease [Dehalococcoidia bacterium]